MFSNSSAGPFFSRTRRAMVPISHFQSTSAVIRRSSPSFSRRAIHCRISMNFIACSHRRLTPASNQSAFAQELHHLSRPETSFSLPLLVAARKQQIDALEVGLAGDRIDG